MSRVLMIGALLAALGAGQSVTAQQLQKIGPPAELPPASYTSSLYVDSKGCAYIRAGRGGATTWIPRVTRKRRHMCGLQPSVVRRTAAAPVATQKPLPVRRVPTPKPRVVATAPTPVVVAPRPAPVVRTIGGCANRSALSQKYTNSTGVRCGPQEWSPNNPVTIVVGGGSQGVRKNRVVQADRVPPETVVSRRKIKQYPPAWIGPNPDDRVVGTTAGAPPQGFRRVWKDDRLNTRRGLNNGGTRVRVGGGSLSYVQAGSFSSRNEAAAAANALRARGLPAKVGVGASRNVIMIGPFNTPAEANIVLRRAKSAGYTGAFIR